MTETGGPSSQRLKADREAVSLRQDRQRLFELQQFLAQTDNAPHRRRIDELLQQLQRIEKRLAELAEVA